jgi:hypothetical protein
MKRKATWKFLIILLIFGLLSININMTGITVAQTRDVAVVEVTPYPTKVGLGLNESVDITVVVANQGTEYENFTVTVSYDSTFIETQNVTDLASGTNTTLNFAWDTSGLAVGKYSINATAIFVPDTHTADNTGISTVSVVSPYVAVRPRRTVDTTLTPGKNYMVSIITDYNGSDIWGYDFTLTYNPLVLEGVEVVNGDLIKEDDLQFIAGTFNDTTGRLEQTTAFSMNLSAPLPYPPVNNTGPGVLANVTFTIVGEGESSITLVRGPIGTTTALKRTDGTNVVDYVTDVDPNPARGKFFDGFFQNVEEVVHDMAVIDMVFSPNNVTAGEFVSINVTIENKGTGLEEVEVTVYWGFSAGVPLQPIGDETVTIGSEENKILPFEWDTTEASAGTHPLSAVVDYTFVGIEDANPLDNIKTIDDAVTVKIFAGTPFPIETIIIVVVVIVALVALFFIIRRIRK